jgi:hypothetical protein
MIPKNRAKLADRVGRAAQAALADKGYVSSIDVFLGIGWLDAGAVERWRRGQIGYLERVVGANLARISVAMKLFRAWAAGQGLRASATAYVARRPGRPALRFSQSGNPHIEAAYRTHWVSPELSQKRQERLAATASPAARGAAGDCAGRAVAPLSGEPGPAVSRSPTRRRNSTPTFLPPETVAGRLAQRAPQPPTRSPAGPTPEFRPDCGI